MPEAVITWTMTRTARAEAAERAVTDVEIAAVVADPELDVASAENPRFRCVGRAGLYLVIDPAMRSIVGVDGQKPRVNGRPVAADPSVKIRRRPVTDRPHPGVPASFLARPTSPPPKLVFAAPLPVPVPPVPVPPVPVPPVPVPPVPVPPAVAERAQDPEPLKPKLKPVPDPRPDPDLPSVLNGTLTPRKGPAPGPRPASRPRVTALSVDKLAGVHPGIAAGVRAELKKRGLDESRVVVHSPTNVEIR